MNVILLSAIAVLTITVVFLATKSNRKWGENE